MNQGRTLVAVDIGNHATKLAWYDLAEPLAAIPAPLSTFDYRTADEPPGELLALLSAAGVVWRVASVHRAAQKRLADWVSAHRPQDALRILTYRDLPLAVRTDFPDKVGVDRLAAAVGANALREPGRPAIVVCAGSAATVDLVAADGGFEGGAILPGFRLSAEALFGGADLLPLTMFEPTKEPPPAVGKHTEAAIRSGLFWGLVGAVRELTTRIRAELPVAPQIFITGGDLVRLAPLVDEAQFVPRLVLAGIRRAVASER